MKKVSGFHYIAFFVLAGVNPSQKKRSGYSQILLFKRKGEKLFNRYEKS